MNPEALPNSDKNQLPLVIQQELFGGEMATIRDDVDAYNAYLAERRALAENGVPTYIATGFGEDLRSFEVDYFSDASRRASIAYAPDAETVITWENGVQVKMSLEEALWATKMLGYTKKVS